MVAVRNDRRTAYTEDPRVRMLTAYDVMDRTGLAYETALALVKAKGVRFGTRQYRISEAALARALTPDEKEGAVI